eukprot:SAG22_NODE_8992_length_616_cov_0.791103_1_plen_178_part_10
MPAARRHPHIRTHHHQQPDVGLDYRDAILPRPGQDCCIIGRARLSIAGDLQPATTTEISRIATSCDPKNRVLGVGQPSSWLTSSSFAPSSTGSRTRSAFHLSLQIRKPTRLHFAVRDASGKSLSHRSAQRAQAEKGQCIATDPRWRIWHCACTTHPSGVSKARPASPTLLYQQLPSSK